MTARFLHSFPVRNAFRVLKQNQKMTIVTFILYLLGIPMIMFSGMLESVLESRNPNGISRFDPELYIFIGCFCLGVAVFMGMVAAINSFTELHSKTKVDMLYSLPLTGRQRFFSDYMGGCGMYILPYVISVILGWVILLVMYPLIQQNTDNPQRAWDTFQLGEISKYYALLTFGLLALMLLYFTLSALVTICCGTLFESIYTNVLLNLLIPGTMTAVIAVVSDNVELDFFYMWQAIGFVSPIGGLIYLFYLMSEPTELGFSSYYSWRTFSASQITEHEMLPAYLRWIFAIVILSALLIVAAWQLYVRRKAEHVGKPFIYLAAYYVMLTLVTVAILCIINAGDEAIGPTLLFGAIVYFVMEVIRKRGFRKFWLTIITYIVTVGVTIGMFVLTVYTDCFGRVHYVPSSATINSVAVKFPASFNSDYMIALEYSDRDIISAVTGLHKDFVNVRRHHADPAETLNQTLTDQRMLVLSFDDTYSYDGGYGEYTLSPPYYYRSNINYGNAEYGLYADTGVLYERTVSNYFKAIENGITGSYSTTVEIEINYYTITGSIIHRSYRLLPDEYLKLLATVQDTDLFAQAYGDGLHANMTDALEEYNQQTKTYEIPASGSLRLTASTNDYYGRYNDTARNLFVTGLKDVIDRLSDAYQKDIAAMTPEQFRTSPICCYMYDIPVYEACTETLGLLEGYGFEDFTVSERYGFQTTGVSEYNGYQWSDTLAIRIYKPGTYSATSLDYPCSKIGRMYFQNDTDATPAYQDDCPVIINKLQEYYPELYALMEAAQEQYISAEDCYALVINGSTYIIPSEHADLAEAVIKKESWFMVNNIGGSVPGNVSNSWSDWYYDDEDGTYYSGAPDDWYSWGEYNDDWYEPGYVDEYPA